MMKLTDPSCPKLDVETRLVGKQPLFTPELQRVRSFSYATADATLGAPQQQRFNSWKCPNIAEQRQGMPNGAGTGDHANPKKYLDKFEGRNATTLCEGTNNGMWQGNVKSVINRKYAEISRLFALDAGPHIVFDFGGGCGTQLELLKARNPDIFTSGCDYVPDAVQYALRTKKADKMCAGDCGDLSYIPDGSIDFVLSNAVLYHWDHAKILDILKNHILRVLRVHGCTWHGWMASVDNPNFLGDWVKGFKGWPVVWEVLLEGQLFGYSEYHRTDTSYSIVICKTGEFPK